MALKNLTDSTSETQPKLSHPIVIPTPTATELSHPLSFHHRQTPTVSVVRVFDFFVLTQQFIFRSD